MNLCISCGADNAPGARFCVKCGATVSTAPQPGSWQAQPGDNPYEPAPAPTPAEGQYQGWGAQSSGGYQAPNGGYAQQQQSDYQPSVASTYNSQSGALYVQQAYAQPYGSQAGQKADPLIRLGGWLIDVVGLVICLIPVIVLGAIFGLIPFLNIILVPLIGLLVIPAVAVTYHLLRDSLINGRSAGKHLLKMRVMSKDGSPAPMKARVLRNILFALPLVFMILPIIGHLIGGLLAFAVMVTEVIVLLSTGERVGDKIANTVVVRAS